MDQTLAPPSIHKQRNSVLTDFSVVVVVIGALIIWGLQFIWKRRKLDKSSRELPGPLALPFIGSAFYFIGKPSYIFGQLNRMFHQYPGLFKLWFGMRLFYVVADPEYFKIILSSPHALKKEALYRMMEPLGGHGLFTAPVPKWKKNRKIISPTFNQKILDQFMDIFVECAEVLVQVMEKHSGTGEIDITNLLNRCTLDIICETAMGVQIKAQITNPSFPRWVDRAAEIMMMRICNIFYHSDLIFYNTPIGKEFHNVAEQLRSFTKKVVIDKREQYERKIKDKDQKYVDKEVSKRKAFLDLLIEMNYENEETQFTDEELLDETITIMIAGSDTSATSNCFTLTMLGMHQDIQEKVLAEILEVVGPNKKVEVSHLPQLQYLGRVIKETLRLFPLGAFVVRSLTEDIDLGDCVLQKGNSVLFGILRAHRNEQYWPDPYKFDPDRFLPEEVAKRSPSCYIPFSFGPRNCIGIKYAMMAMKVVLATVVRKYKIFTSYNSVEEVELKTNLVLRPKNGYKVSVQLRN